MKGIIVFFLVFIINAQIHVHQKQSVIDRFVEIALSDTMYPRTRVEALDWLGHSKNEMADFCIL